jgi:SET domain-containing protein
MFNHSSQAQNVAWTRNLDHQTVVYTAIRDIEVGEELCISYGSNLWFEDTDISNTPPEKESDILESIQPDLNEDDAG